MVLSESTSPQLISPWWLLESCERDLSVSVFFYDNTKDCCDYGLIRMCLETELMVLSWLWLYLSYFLRRPIFVLLDELSVCRIGL